MKLDNPFPLEVKTLYLYRHDCSICGSNGNNRGGLALHHITGRTKGNWWTASALNSILVCGTCHETLNHNEEEEKFLFNKTLKFLKGENYKLIEIDFVFLQNNPRLLRNNQDLDLWLKS